MDEKRVSTDDLGQLAEETMADKREEMGSETQARELYDVPTQSAATLAEEQADEKD